MTRRLRLPNRRPCLTTTIDFQRADGSIAEFQATAGFDPIGRVREVFLSSGRPGSDIDALLNDAGIVISLALQHGTPAQALALSAGFIAGDPPRPVSPIGAALALCSPSSRPRGSSNDPRLCPPGNTKARRRR
jgi:hypothetical protein